MKAKEVQIQGEYLTKVGDQRVRVRVISRRETDRGPRFVVARVDNGFVLPKARHAAALIPIPRTT